MPAIGHGTFGSDRYGAAEVAAAVKNAIAGGCRHIDCAAAYSDDKGIGDALAGRIDRAGNGNPASSPTA
jgi:diketogulonate reductase-like aldo/keto reductase